MNMTLPVNFRAILIVIATLLLALTLPNPAKMQDFFVHGSYAIMAVLFFVWLGILLKHAIASKADPKAFLRSYGPGILFAVALSIFIFVSVKPSLRVLADETNVLAVSKSMVYERAVDNVTEAKWYFLNFQPISRVLEKRSLLFPFFASIIHILTGYRLENVFVLNFFALAALLSLLHIWFKKHLGAAWSYIMLFLVVSQPIVSLCAASGGLELLQVLFLLIAFMSLERFMEDASAANFELLWINLIMLCHTRYESFIFFIVCMALLGYFKYIRLEFFTKSALYALTPILCLPILWQRILMRGHFQEPPGVPVFAVEHYIKYNVMFLKNLFNFQFFLPYANVVNLVGLAGLLYFVQKIFERNPQKSKTRAHFLLFVLVLMCCSWIIFTSHFLGTMELPSSGRFYLMFCIALSLAAGLMLYQLRGILPTRITAVAALAAFCVYHPIAVENRFINSQVIIREYRFVDDFLKKLNDPNLLLVYGAPGFFTVRNYGSVHYSHANANKEQILNEYKRRLFSDIYVVQEISYDSGKPTDETALVSDYELEPLTGLQNTAETYLRMSKVVNKR